MRAINKQKVIDTIISEIQKELEVAIQAAKTAHADATNEESKPENEYDTRALEASYVARGQAERVAQLKESLYEYRHLPVKNFGDRDPITATALIEVESQDKKSILLFMPKGGGFTVNIEGQRIQVVTPGTPLGQALLQMKKGDNVFVDLGTQEREYEILDVM
jgi:hypothetical protein